MIRAAAEDDWLRIEVDDDGPGIPPAERDNVFRPFYRLDHARNQDTGNTGLGLAIARDIARSHGGDIALGDQLHGRPAGHHARAAVSAARLIPAILCMPAKHC